MRVLADFGHGAFSMHSRPRLKLAIVFLRPQTTQPTEATFPVCRLWFDPWGELEFNLRHVSGYVDRRGGTRIRF
jgi:hypothetical protein